MVENDAIQIESKQIENSEQLNIRMRIRTVYQFEDFFLFAQHFARRMYVREKPNSNYYLLVAFVMRITFDVN